MSTKLLTGHHVEFLSLKEGCTGSFESELVKMKAHVVAYIVVLLSRQQRLLLMGRVYLCACTDLTLYLFC